MGTKDKKVSSDICWTQGCCTRRNGKTISERNISFIGTYQLLVHKSERERIDGWKFDRNSNWVTKRGVERAEGCES